MVESKRPRNKLTDTQVKNARPGKISDGGGLWLHCTASGGKYWFVRVTVHGRRREINLGVYPAVSLAEARAKADEMRSLAKTGIDPAKERRERKRKAQKELKLLADVAADCFESRKAELKGDGVNGRWFSPLELHVLPKLGKVPVVEIDQIDIRDALVPIWHTKAPTAMKAIDRLNVCLNHAVALGLDVDVQAVKKAKVLLGKQRHQTKHIESMPWQEVPEFFASLNDGTTTQLALKLLILTGLRSKPIRFCHVDQIEGDVWTVPAEYMKSLKGKEEDFRTPLSSDALKVIEEALPLARDGWLFPGIRKGVISDMTMSKYMRDKGLKYRPHGFRATFRTWCAEPEEDRKDVSRVAYDVAETALAHKPGNKVERTYQRGDLLEQRRTVMTRWSNFVCGRSGKLVRMADPVSVAT